jgi:hypothetical protein
MSPRKSRTGGPASFKSTPPLLICTNPRQPPVSTIPLSVYPDTSDTSYQLTPNLQLFGLLQNAFNTTFYTFGTFSPTSSVFIAQAPGVTNPRSYSPGAPIAGTVGIRLTF